MDSMDRVAQERLHNAAKYVSEAHVSLSVAHTQNALALRDGDGARDFRARLETLIQATAQLAADILEVAGPLEPHGGIRKVLAHDAEHPTDCKRPGCIICTVRTINRAAKAAAAVSLLCVDRECPVHGDREHRAGMEDEYIGEFGDGPVCSVAAYNKVRAED